MQYGSFGEDGLSDALADLNDAFGELDGFGEMAKGSLKLAIPVVVGMGVTFGAAEALDYFIEDPATRESVLPYKWLIAGGVGTLAGIIMWKVPALGGSTAGIVTIAASLMMVLLYYVKKWVSESGTTTTTTPPAGRFRAYNVASPTPIYGRFGRYEVKSPTVLDQSPVYSGLGEGQMVNLGGYGEGQMVNLATARSSVLQGAVNPGVFG